MKCPKVNPEIKKIPNLSLDDMGVPKLTVQNIKEVYNYVSNQSSYSPNVSGDFARKYFQDHTGDRDITSVIMKIIIVDTIDSTNLKQLLGGNYYIELAKRIQASHIEDDIAAGKKIGSKFKEIAEFSKESGFRKNLNLFIFLSKYITRVSEYCYNGNNYSILDGVIRDNLKYYKGQVDVPDIESLRVNYCYDDYCNAITEILKGLPDITRAAFDQFIWFTFKEPTV